MRYGFTLMFLVLSVCVLGLFVMEHEDAHRAIWAYDGVSSHFGFDWNTLSAQTIASRDCVTPECRGAHMSNEVVGYNVGGVIAIVMTGFFVIIIMKEYNNE